MIKWPHAYYINRWYGAMGEDTALVYRTDNLADFINHVEEETKKHKLNSSNSKIIVRGDRTFFSYYVDFGGYAWTHMHYYTNPDKIYRTLDDYKRSVKKKLEAECRDSQANAICMTA